MARPRVRRRRRRIINETLVACSPPREFPARPCGIPVVAVQLGVCELAKRSSKSSNHRVADVFFKLQGWAVLHASAHRLGRCGILCSI